MKLLQLAIGPELQSEAITYDVAFNTSEGKYFDLLQSLAQKQIEFESNFLLWLAKPTVAPDWFRQLVADLVTATYTLYSSDVAEHVSQYKNALRNGEKVFVVAHSQGNLYVNAAKISLSATTPVPPMASFGIYGVATPADNVGGDVIPYLTNNKDVIRLVPRALPSNFILGYALNGGLITEIGGIEAHLFDTMYMSTIYNVRDALVENVKAAMMALADPIPDCSALPIPVPPQPIPGNPSGLPVPLLSLLVGELASNGKCLPNTSSQIVIQIDGSIVGSGCFAIYNFPAGTSYRFEQAGSILYGGSFTAFLEISHGFSSDPYKLIAFSQPNLPNAIGGGGFYNVVSAITIDKRARLSQFLAFINGRQCTASYIDDLDAGNSISAPNSYLEVAGNELIMHGPAGVIGRASLTTILGDDFLYEERHNDQLTSLEHGMSVSTQHFDANDAAHTLAIYVGDNKNFRIATDFVFPSSRSHSLGCVASE